MNGQLARKLRQRIFGKRKMYKGRLTPGYVFRQYLSNGHSIIADELRGTYQAIKKQISRSGT